ncbi:MAG: TPM domain-containing protein [Clostridia bacterium]|nr:TPM domain-containing protein [Clostridia bacterium]
MKRKWICLLLLLAALLCLSVPAAAEVSGYVLFDNDDFFTDEELSELNDCAFGIAERYGCGIYVVMLEDYTEYTDGDVRDCAELVYTEFELGWGEGHDGVMLLLSMADRDYALIAYGDKGNASFTDYGKDVLSDEFLPYFRYDDWMGGFRAYQDACKDFLRQAEAGEPVDDYGYSDYGYSDEPHEMSDGTKAGITVAAPSLAALGVCQGMKRKMKSARRQTDARRYVSQGLHLYANQDTFTHRTETRRVIQTEQRSHSGRGTTVSSSGFSGKSGKF